MPDRARILEALGHDPPLTASRPPFRFRLPHNSRRWLSGVCISGVAAAALVGLSLATALRPVDSSTAPTRTIVRHASFDSVAKARRVAQRQRDANQPDRRRFEMRSAGRATGQEGMTRDAPHVFLRLALDAEGADVGPYPPFDPLGVVSDDGEAAGGALVDMSVGGAATASVSLGIVDLDVETAGFAEADWLSDAEAERDARMTEAMLAAPPVAVAGFLPFDPHRFEGVRSRPQAAAARTGPRVTSENVSVARPSDASVIAFSEATLTLARGGSVAEMLAGAGFGPDAERIERALGSNFFADPPQTERVLKLGLESRSGETRIVRASLHVEGARLATVARTDGGAFVAARAPERLPRRNAALAGFGLPTPGPGLTVYDAINRAALAQGLSPRLTRQLVRLLAADVDHQAALQPSDRLDLMFSEPDAEDHATAGSELVHVRFAIGGGYGARYRYETPDGAAAYFGPEGRTAQRFLLSSPVPEGRFESGFGLRRHPILGEERMHAGVDWAAPEGTPILASAAGVIEYADWNGGYGRQTRIRHANGYATSYSHQSGFAEGTVSGAAVRQGEVIGFVGSTGLSTGSHLHYEVSIDGDAVDPLRVRAPRSKALLGPELDAFLAERDRIDALLYDAGEGMLRLAASSR